MNTENIDIVFIQEPYVYQNRIKGITKGYRTYACGEEKSRAAIIIPNDTIDAIMITQCSDNDMVLLEIKMGQETFYAASAYMEYNDAIEKSLKKIERILEFIKGVKIIKQ
jgi:SAM-dependent MidA family methyltransferase